MITIYSNLHLEPEKLYIFDVIFSEFLGLEYQVELQAEFEGITIKLANNSELVLSSSGWDSFNDLYLSNESLPTVNYAKNQFTPESDIPILYGSDILELSEARVVCGQDIFAGCFFILSRMEEVIIEERDNHDRFPAIASTAYKSGFLERPVVDEYTEFLWNMLVYLDSTLTRKERHSTTFVTCDVDWPYDPRKYSFIGTAKSSAADIFKRKNVKSALTKWINYFGTKLNLDVKDEYFERIKWMMDVNEKFGNKVAFYFITEMTSKLDSDFDFDSDQMRCLLRLITARGHEIGIHPGYNCYVDQVNFKKSVDTLKRILKEENNIQPIIGGRMHYLRWDAKTTPSLWEENELSYDSTLSFADKAGFRCGTSHEFKMYDLLNRKTLNLKQRPLINMECTIIEDKYEGFGYSKMSIDRFNLFRGITRKYGGIYTLLWHNTSFNNKRDKEFYLSLISQK